MVSRGDRVAVPAELEAARLVLAWMGIEPADLVGELPPRRVVPTFAEYVPVVAAAVGAGSRRAYGSYWNKIRTAWGEQRLDEPTPTTIAQQVEQVRAGAVVRSNGRGGRSAAENCVAALRCLYNHAVADGYIDEVDDPARKVAKPGRLPSSRSAVADVGLADINQIAATTAAHRNGAGQGGPRTGTT